MRKSLCDEYAGAPVHRSNKVLDLFSQFAPAILKHNWVVDSVRLCGTDTYVLLTNKARALVLYVHEYGYITREQRDSDGRLHRLHAPIERPKVYRVRNKTRIAIDRWQAEMIAYDRAPSDETCLNISRDLTGLSSCLKTYNALQPTTDK